MTTPDMSQEDVDALRCLVTMCGDNIPLRYAQPLAKAVAFITASLESQRVSDPGAGEALPTLEEMRLLLDRLCMAYFGQGKNGLPGVRRLALESAISRLHEAALRAPQQEGGAPRPEADWHEDSGPVLWWQFSDATGEVFEPPYCGTPLDFDWPGYHTHWTPLPPPPSLAGTKTTGRGPSDG